MSLNPRFTTRPIPVSRELTAPATHSRLPNFNPEQKLRRAIADCDDFEVEIHVCQYLRTVLDDYGDAGRVAARMVDLIEEVIK